jgi:RimJ/RimL family protein N-acetyltransferase
MPSVDRDVTGDYLAFWSETLDAEFNRAWIAEDSGSSIGFLVAGTPVHEDLLDLPVLELIALYLVPKVWGSGVADALHGCFTRFQRDCSREGVLDVWSGNLRALAFYGRHGWTPDGRSRPGPGGQPFIGLRLPTPLSRSERADHRRTESSPGKGGQRGIETPNRPTSAL